jgi:SnoaL-like domain
VSEVSVEDELRIRRLYNRCYWALNSGDEQGVIDCFAPEGFIEMYNGNIVTREQSGAGAVASRSDPVMATRQHHITNFLVDEDPEGNPKRRSVRLYFLVTQVYEPPKTELRNSCFGNDIVELIGDEWKIVKRKISLNHLSTAYPRLLGPYA